MQTASTVIREAEGPTSTTEKLNSLLRETAFKYGKLEKKVGDNFFSCKKKSTRLPRGLNLRTGAPSTS